MDKKELETVILKNIGKTVLEYNRNQAKYLHVVWGNFLIEI